MGGSASPGFEVGGGGSVVLPEDGLLSVFPTPSPFTLLSSGPDGDVGPYPLFSCLFEWLYSQLLVISWHLVVQEDRSWKLAFFPTI